MTPVISVIVPVRDDAGMLADCLEALARQRHAPASEVLVIDNGAPPGLCELVGRFPGARYVREAAPGSYAARNAGLGVARGEVIAFTDADCRPRDDWFAQGLAALDRHPACSLVAGRIDLSFAESSPTSAAEWFELVNAFRQEEYVARWHFGATANLFTRRARFDAHGLFDPTLPSGGDREWGERLHAAGLRAVYAADVVVEHPARRTVRAVLAKHRRVAIGLARRNEFAALGRREFARRVARDWPRLPDVARALRDPRLPGLGPAARVLGVMAAVRSWRALTYLCVRLTDRAWEDATGRDLEPRTDPSLEAQSESPTLDRTVLRG